jgi:hypothetical protein
VLGKLGINIANINLGLAEVGGTPSRRCRSTASSMKPISRKLPRYPARR